MKQLGLYPQDAGYIIDTMVLICVGRTFNPVEIRKSARKILDHQVARRQVISSMQVFDEVFDKDKKEQGDEVCILADTLKERGVFQQITQEDQENIAVVLAQFPSFLKSDSEKPDADPWLVALAMRYEQWTIVTRDGAMRKVCKHFDIPCFTDIDYFKKYGWKL